MTDNLTVFIVDDDPAIRDALSLLLGLHDYRVTMFGDAESFLKSFKKTWRGCVLLDLRLHGMDGLAMQKRLREMGGELPVIIMTGHGDVASARAAFLASAVDFLEKPLDQPLLLASIERAFSGQRAKAEDQSSQGQTARLMGKLTPREREIMQRVVAGQHNRDIAVDLSISTRTVEVHKTNMMGKLGVRSVADLVRLNLQFEQGRG
jgi:FixJ family two-component response regulator